MQDLGSCLPVTGHINLFRDIVPTNSAQRPRREVLDRTANSAKPLQPAVDLIPRSDRRKIGLAKILIVDDDGAVRATITILLERAGHSVVAASDGRKGLALFEAGDFDLLFLDIFMPGMDGIETMRQVHQMQPTIPIIVISGNPMAADSGPGPNFLKMATKLGAVSSLQKPFKSSALLAAVAGCLEAAKGPFPSSATAGDVAPQP
jgi:CheY-like chemotaxis protein